MLKNGGSPAANNDPLLQWNDQSGLNNHLVAENIGAVQTGVYKSAGLNEKKTVDFQTGSHHAMHCSSFPIGTGNKAPVYIYGSITSAADAFTIVACYLAPTQDVGGSHSCTWVRLMTPALSLRADHIAVANSTGTVSLDTGTRFGSSYDGTNNTFIVNGAEQTPWPSRLILLTQASL